jgi:tetratricopeptide (TPR) repeat protein
LELNKTVEAIEVFRGVALEAEAIESDFLGLFYAYATIGDEKNALAVLSMAHAAGKLDRGSSLSIYSNVLAREGAAYKAAKLLSRAIDEGKIDKTAQNYERAFYAYRQAREGKEALRAIGAAIDLDPSAKLYAQAAHTSFGVGDFGAAIAAAQRAIDLNASRSESLRLLIGAAAIEIKDYVLARSAFAEALKSRRYAKEAKNWLRYLDEITNKGKS